MSIRVHEERVRAHLDELRARAQERSWVVHVLGDLHRTDHVEPPWSSHELVAGWVLEDERVGEARVRCDVARRDADVLWGRVVGVCVSAKTCEALSVQCVRACQPVCVQW